MPTVEKVTFPSRGLKVVGELRIPDNASEKKNAAVVIAHPMTSVKEQSPRNYADALTNAGFYTLTYDAAYQGESEGEPRLLEDPYQRAWDNSAAVDYLTTRKEIDAERIGIVGICASGGYVSFAAQTDPRMKAVATVSGADTGSLFRDGMPKGSTSRDQLKEQLKAVSQLRTGEASGGEPVSNDVISPDYRNLPAGTMWHEVGYYYRTPRAEHPRAPNKVLSRSLALIANYDSYRFNELIAPRPYLAVAGEKADTLYHSEDAVNSAQEPKELFKVPGATHVDLYDKIEVSSKKLIEYFTQYLAQ